MVENPILHIYMLKQHLSQKLLQKLSPQQIQFIKLLQLNTVDFEQRVEEELIDNPALDTGKDDAESYEKDGQEEFETPQEDFDISDYLSDDDYGGFKLSDSNDPDEDRQEIPVSSQESLTEKLLDQISPNITDEHEMRLAAQLIGSIEEDGYIRRPIEAIVNDLAFSNNVMTTKEELEKVLHKVQLLDPPGIGARSLQECLLIQLKRISIDKHPELPLAVTIVEKHMEDFSKKHYDKMLKQLKIDEDELREAIALITKLNPKPGESQTSARTQYITPDFIVKEEEGEFNITLNGRNAPDLKVSRSYQETLQGYEKSNKPDKNLKDTVQFIKQKLDSAKWFIDSIKQRQNTLLSTMKAILEYQREFFYDGDETKLRPMILKDIAEKVELDVSTISRVANSKYVQTDFGIFPLKFFFSEGITTEDGEEVSNREVKKILTDAIAAEDKQKPLPDEKLMELLKEKGYNIARRTVAKYREQLNIPVARLRKQL